MEVNLKYLVTGESNKETLLFVHGVGGNADQFQKQHDFFSNHYRVVSLSLRGHGGSPKPSPNTSNQYALGVLAGDIIKLIEELDLDNIHYVGNSAGGVLGYIVVRKITHRFLSLTTFGTTGQMKFPKFLSPVFSGFDTFLLRFFKNWYLHLMASHTATNEASKKACYQMFVKATSAIPHFRYNLVNYDFTGFISQSPIPYTLIKCEFDKGINGMLSSTLKAIQTNKTANMVELKGVGHVANLDDPEVFNNCLYEILKNING